MLTPLGVQQRGTLHKVICHCVVLVALTSIFICALAASMELFQVKLIEQDSSRLIATSNYNYALASPKLLAKGWQTVSVNGDKVYLTLATTGEQRVTSRAELGADDMQFIETLRDEIANASGASGYSHVTTFGSGGGGDGSMLSSSSSSGGSYMMSSSQSGGSSSMFSSSSLNGGGSGGSGSVSGTSGDMSYNMRDEDNFSVTRSDLPFSWSRVFFNGNTLTFVFRNGDVRMQPLSSLEASQLDAANNIKRTLKEMKQSQAQMASQTMRHSMDMVSNVFSNIMGSFPRPPDYQASVGNMFGNNFPFGPNNSPFSTASGWPFASSGGGGGGVGAIAYAGRRR